KVTCYQGGLNVPLIVHAPGRVGSGMVREELTSHVDILPTVLDLLELPAQAHRPGLSLGPLLGWSGADPALAWRETLVGEWTGSPTSWYPQRSIRNQRYKLIVNYLADRPNRGMAAY